MEFAAAKAPFRTPQKFMTKTSIFVENAKFGLTAAGTSVRIRQNRGFLIGR